MRRGVPVLVVVLAVGTLVASATVAVELVTPAGTPLAWQAWLDEHAPVAVLFWASWTPDAGTVRDRFGELARAAADQELELVVIDVQEPYEEARAALGESATPWLHDRHGELLKAYRVIRVPALLVVDSRGRRLAELAPDPKALREWQPR